MRAVNSAVSSLVLCLAVSGLSLTIENPEINIFKPEDPKKIPSEPVTVGTSNVTIKSRILDVDYDPSNATSLVTIETDSTNADAEDASTTSISVEAPMPTQCPQSPTVMDFKPSTHLGEIDGYETRKSSDIDKHTFDSSKHTWFENEMRIEEFPDTDRVHVRTGPFRGSDRSAGAIAETNNIPVNLFETDGRYGVAVPVDVVHHEHRPEYYEPHQIHLQMPVQQIHHDHGDNVDDDKNHYQSDNLATSLGQETLVTFEYPRSQGHANSRPVVSFPRPAYMTPSKLLPIHYQSQHYEISSDDSAHVKPSKLYNNPAAPAQNNAHYQIYEYTPTSEAIEKPQVHAFRHQSGSYSGDNYNQAGDYHRGNNYQAFSQDHLADQIGKPETVFYVTSHRESAVTRMRKFPYKFYEPAVIGHHNIENHYALQDVPYAFPIKEQRISPWKKIFHLIGTFLPLGLLLATFKPNIVKIENTTQPNIVLSKLRVVDLPAEHKRGRLLDNDQAKFQQDTCDDRFICELIVNGSEPTSNLLQNILLNLTNKSIEKEAKKHGLYEIFAAVKRKDCSSIDC